MASTDHDQIPHLLKLAADESRMVRDSALGKLCEFGASLDKQLRKLESPPNDQEHEQLRRAMAEYRERLEQFHKGEPVGTLIGRALFEPGELVRHRRYGYRGVVVERDLSCRASEDWYQSNRTHPDREQPWYHVLVNDVDAATYAAQTSLLPDDETTEIRNGLVPYFFKRFKKGRYLRNEMPWREKP